MALSSTRTIMEFNLVTLLLFAPSIIVLSYILNYILDPHGIRSIPGPLFAKFTDAWLALVAKDGHRSEVVHELHKKFGTYLPPFRPYFHSLLFSRNFRPPRP